jgi:hypothetical protein
MTKRHCVTVRRDDPRLLRRHECVFWECELCGSESDDVELAGIVGGRDQQRGPGRVG